MIRSAHAGDARAVQSIYAPYVIDTTISFEDTPPTIDEMTRRIAASHLFLVTEDDAGVVVGFAYAAAFHERAAYRGSVEVTIYLKPNQRGRGLGGALLDALMLQLDPIQFRMAVAVIAVPNIASVALFERRGFAAAGVLHDIGYKHNTWLDVGWWQRRIPAAAAHE